MQRPACSLFGAAVLTTLVPDLSAQVEPHGAMLRYPDVGQDSIVFAYANDLWTVSRDGGMATPLASPQGQELFPKFSDDGKTIAFMGNYDGGRDIYTVPTGGGLPTRVTHHPSGETLCGWTPDGGLLFYTRGLEGMPQGSQLFTVASQGGMPDRIPVPYGAAGAISPDGKWIAYTPHTRDGRTWKRYRGGMATDIWLFNLESNESRQITEWEGTDTLPMWHSDDKLYYLSDNGDEHRLNIWMYEPRSGRRTQITRFSEYDVKWPSIGPREIVFQNGADLYLLDLRSGQTRTVSVTIPGARPSIRPKRVDTSKYSTWWSISPTGKRAVVEARGDIWTLPAEKGVPRNLTRTSGAAEREASWSPDGRWIAYFSDATGEYELYITQSDGKGDTKQLTSNSTTFYYDPVWSPDSKHIVFQDKAAKTYLHTIESGETKVVYRDPWGNRERPSWSHDSRWLAYAKSLDDAPLSAIHLYNVETGEESKVTSGMFPDSSPAFDRKGDFLYFASSRSFNPTYSDVDTTFVYNQSGVLLAVPLRDDVKSPWLPESDEEEWKDEEEETDEEEGEGEEGEGEEGDEADTDEGDEEGDDEPAEPAVDDGVSGTWEGTLQGGEMPPGMEFTMTLWLDGTSLTGSIAVPMGTASLEGTFDKASGAAEGTITTDGGESGAFTGTISGTSMKFQVTMQGQTIELVGTRSGAAVAAADDENGENGKSDKPAEVVVIDIDGFERRAMQLPVGRGNFGNLVVNNKNHLLYTKSEPNSGSEIMVFDIEDDKKQAKSVAKGAGAFELSANGKKLIILRGAGAAIQNASAGASSKNVPTGGMIVSIDPRSEWEQLFTEAWRLQRDFFYVDNMHGVDWQGVREQYGAMLADCVTREDVSYIIREMISELNIGHAYYGGGDTESENFVPVGMLGVDWELDEGAYRIAAIHEGAAWDVDARGPLCQPGVDANVGDYLLAVNGIPVDTAKDPWASFQGLAGQTTVLTLNASPEYDENIREVVVTPSGGEQNLRYRGWIERNRKYVEEQTGGQVGYIYVPNTGVVGQNDLYRQFLGQFGKKALIIDERWNGGGQIPTRFIELLNRPVRNYWARRDAKDWAWPPDAHNGPKCMLINGLAGSGGDLFPWYFKQAGLGPTIGTRTWGGLVGISGNPGLIDGGRVTVPTFGFYENDGTWGVEGHGVDADIEVLDDPALMVNGGDPQLDAAIAYCVEELQRNPYVAPLRPSPPDRSGMGVTESDK